MSSGDRRTFRNLYGSSFSAVFKPQILVASNEVPRLPVNEPSISRRIHGLDFQSTFSTEVDVDDYASRTFIKHDLTEEAKRRRLASFHLLLKFFREDYRAHNNRIYEGGSPSIAIEMMQENAPFGDFEDHIDDRYDRIDRGHMRGQAQFCVHISEVVDGYNHAQGRGERTLDLRTAKQLLSKIGLWDVDNHRHSQKINNKRDMVLLKKKVTTSSQAENNLAALIEKKFRVKLERNIRPPWLRVPQKTTTLELDMFLPEKNLAIEYDGPQHYEFPNPFHSTRGEFEHQQNLDRLKEELCFKKGVTLVRIRHDLEKPLEFLSHLFE